MAESFKKWNEGQLLAMNRCPATFTSAHNLLLSYMKPKRSPKERKQNVWKEELTSVTGTAFVKRSTTPIPGACGNVFLNVR